MIELLFLFIFLGVSVFLFALVGHGLWLAGGAILRALTGRKKALSNRGTGSPPFPQELPPLADAERGALARTLNRLHAAGRISSEAYREIVAVLQTDDHQYRDAEFLGDALEGEIAEAEIVEAELAEGEPPQLPSPGVEPPVSRPRHPLDFTPEEEQERLSPHFAPAGPTAAAVAAEPRRSWAELALSFMEQRNIRWGELLAGLLIVGGSMGLVISLWATLREYRYVPALLFLLVTACIYGAGMYTLRRWKLKTTSRGVLTIALLLVPLNFLTAIALSQGREAYDALYYLAVAVGLLAYGGITASASHALARASWPRLTLALMGGSASMLVISRVAGPELGAAGRGGLALLASLGALLALTWHAHWLSGRAAGKKHAEETGLVIGLAGFALTAAWGLLVWRGGAAAATFTAGAPVMLAVGAQLLAVGLLLAGRGRPHLPLLRVAGTWLALLAAFLMLTAAGLAWPEPYLLCVCGVTGCALLSLTALAARTPSLHAAALGCGTLALAVGWHARPGGLLEPPVDSARLLEAIFSGRGGVVLLTWAGLLAAGGWAWSRAGRAAEGAWYFASAGGAVLLAVAAALTAGFFTGVDAPLATPILLLAAAGLLAGAFGFPHSALTLAGSLTLLAGLVQGLRFNPWLAEHLQAFSMFPPQPLVAALLLHAGGISFLAWLIRPPALNGSTATPAARRWREVSQPLAYSALGSGLAVVPAFTLFPESTFAIQGAHAAGLALAWLFALLTLRRAEALPFFQAALVAALAYSLAGWWGIENWTDPELRSPRFLHYLIALLAGACALWSVVRHAAWRSAAVHRVLDSHPVSLDRLLLGLLTAAVYGLPLLALLPGLGVELGLIDLADLPLSAAGAGLYFAPSAYLALAAVAGALLLSLRERCTAARLTGLLAAGGALAALLAGPALAQGHGGGAWRWGSAALLLVITPPLLARGRLIDWVRGRFWIGWEQLEPFTLPLLYGTALVVGFGPIVATTLPAVLQHSADLLPEHQLLTAWRQPWLGALLLYGGPLLLAAGCLTAWAAREREPGAVGGASLLTLFAAASMFLLAQGPTRFLPPAPLWAGLWGALTAALGLFGLLWWLLERRRPGGYSLGFELQCGAAGLALLLLAGLLAGSVLLGPADPAPLLPAFGNAWLLAALLAAFVFLLTAAPGARRAWLGHAAGLGLAALAGWIAAAVDRPAPERWSAAHGLEIAYLAAAALLMLLAVWRDSRFAPRNLLGEALPRLRPAACTGWGALLLAGAAAAALQGIGADPWEPLGPTAILSGVIALLSLTALGRGRQRWAWAATFLAPLVVFAGGHSYFFSGGPPAEPHAVFAWISAMLAAPALLALGWLALELRDQRGAGRALFAASPALRVHRFLGGLLPCAWLALLLFGLLIRVLAYTLKGSNELPVSSLPMWLAWGTAAALVVGSLWDRRAWAAWFWLYLLGYSAVLMVLDQLALTPRDWVLGIATGAAVYHLAAALAWSNAELLVRLGRRLGVEEPAAGLPRTWRWLVTFTLLWTGAILWVQTLGVSLYEERGLRFLAAGSVLLPALASGLLARAQDAWLRTAALLLGLYASVLLSWADLHHVQGTDLLFARAVRVLIAASLAGAAMGVLRRWSGLPPRWDRPFAAAGGLSLLAAGIAIFVVLGAEVVNFTPGVGSGLPLPHAVAVAAALGVLFASLLVMALSPARDPLGLSDAWRQGYVYAAQGVLAILFAHLYLARPFWFDGLLRPWWPYLVMALAFGGIGLGEFCRRRKIHVLGEPLGQTGLLLPLIPTLAWWVLAGDRALGEYSLVLLLAGLLYALTAYLRKSLAATVAAAVAANASLWAFWHESDWRFTLHPQLWLIPPAVSLLVAAQLNRRRLTAGQLAGIRYGTVLVIYLSSAGEIFINGLGESLWPPMVLALLSVLGAGAGVALRVRAFLYAGTTFLFLSVVSMVWHAWQAVGHTWPWWVFGIGLGIAILVFFGLLEKKRSELQGMVDRLRTWDR